MNEKESLRPGSEAAVIKDVASILEAEPASTCVRTLIGT